ncbi:MAG TPA: SEC-C metal-binding domain-containing protein [Polyangiaceae bacterium]|jgi:hypothetical protein|nr:MAG: hypothetical protein BWY17_00330 [Deltaproteobacteria bacterium ADurb.Bin207]HNS97154.1 SEC-C metal-binding domain-containing protein [Polyangiaceae bacterium]HNZ22181.1 SEC-C metal-binding domain-containing protein [Polyangiaceae bacterium]HOD23976.1 SEC-C metal-binding domain-containing protein [Polyangiaceae bacterium]HOE47005.1 SEC-C metal-binding domain-containing protein [Polyangiaceae bacterium]
MKVGPNEPCPCGSGKKYKKCCWLKDRETEAEAVRENRNVGAVAADVPKAKPESFAPANRSKGKKTVRSDAPRRRAV